MPLSQAQAVIDRLRADADVEWVAPDLPVRRQQQTPPDQGFATLQWNLLAPTTPFNTPTTAGGTKTFIPTGGANLPTAWARSVGSASVTVAVIDTGVALGHRDLRGRFAPGYDFVSGSALTSLGAPLNFVANDGDGRDADPTDPGDWVTSAEETAYPNACANSAAGSSWHGTHMAGIVAAQWGDDVEAATNTIRAGTRTAGIGPALRILPVRALGKCGGTSTDVIDAMYWAAGLAVPGVPANPNPARVINLSLGGSTGACVAGSTYANAINAVLNTGAIVVAAAGNDATEAALQPANCPGVISVTAHVINGDNADYANIARRSNPGEVTISAPGGGAPSLLQLVNPPLATNDNAYVIWSTGLFGATTPTSPASANDNRSGDAILGLTGTSPATPHVAAAAALLLSVRPTLNRIQVTDILTTTARQYPAGTYCAAGQPGQGLCGVGLLDVGAALAALQPTAPAVPPAAPALPPEPVPPPPPIGGGGGSLPLAPLLLLAALSIARQMRRRD
ncbi:MAG: S8 family serine peptidase [Burkholderiaceae bacterium]|nr:S8 family serine peptidase [Burkholderiaceae bacterium]